MGVGDTDNNTEPAMDPRFLEQNELEPDLFKLIVEIDVEPPVWVEKFINTELEEPEAAKLNVGIEVEPPPLWEHKCFNVELDELQDTVNLCMDTKIEFIPPPVWEDKYTDTSFEELEAAKMNVFIEVEATPPPDCVDYEILLVCNDDMRVWTDMFKCVKCPRADLTKEDHDIHVEKHHNNTRNTRNICDYKPRTYKLMNMHLYVRHKYNLPYACRSCNSKFSTKRAFRQHKRMRHAAKTSPRKPSQPRHPAPVPFQPRCHCKRLVTLLLSDDVAKKIGNSRHAKDQPFNSCGICNNSRQAAHDMTVSNE